jgi:hypothetical protein
MRIEKKAPQVLRIRIRNRAGYETALGPDLVFGILFLGTMQIWL